MHELWNNAAELRRTQIESGLDLTFSRVFVPYFIECIKKYEPCTIAEVGGGTGHLALNLFGRVKRYEVIEPSAGMHRVPCAVLAGTRVMVHCCRVQDFSENSQFDLVLSHLCGNVVQDVEECFADCSRLVSPGGRLVFSLPHPCFWNVYKEVFPTQEFRYHKEQSKLTTLTITKDSSTIIANIPFHHRPLGRYIAALANCGFSVEVLDEIVPSEEVQAEYGKEWQYPRYCVIHARWSVHKDSRN